MMATLSDTYMIATRMDGFAQGVARHPAVRAEPVKSTPRGPGGSPFGWVIKMYRQWRAAAETRQAVSTLTPHQLRDIGLDEADVQEMQWRPFWQL